MPHKEDVAVEPAGPTDSEAIDGRRVGEETQQVESIMISNDDFTSYFKPRCLDCPPFQVGSLIPFRNIFANAGILKQASILHENTRELTSPQKMGLSQSENGFFEDSMLGL